MSEYLPLEIQREILKRLPLKPLIQFRSVSKPWKSLIDSPDFLVSYGVRHPHPNRFILRYRLPLYSEYYGEEKCIAFFDNDDSFVQRDFLPTIPDLAKKNTDILSVVGSSHGLLCFYGYYKYPDDHSSNRHGTEMVVLWNPSIRKSVGIQVPYVYDSPKQNLCIIGLVCVVGFGVCPVTFDPIILKIKGFQYTQKMVPWNVQVFTLSTGTWSTLSTNLPRESIRLGGSQVVINRFIYWVAFDKPEAEDGRSQLWLHYLILSFDLTAKEFKEIDLPDSLSNHICNIQTISKLKESLVVLEYHTKSGEDVSVCSLWMMMEELGVNRSFRKLYNINLLSDVTVNQILGFRKTGELILETEQEDEEKAEFEIYNPNSEVIDNLGIDGDSCTFFMCSYMETLLLLNQLDGFTYSMGN